MTTRHGDAAQRLATYQGLMARNRIVSILRIGVPVMGALLLVALIGQIYVSSLGSRFGVGQITVTPDSVTVEAPEYTGLLDDGTAYHIAASGAQAATDAIDKIRLNEATITMTRPDGLVTTVDARAATLDTTRQLVFVEQEAQVGNSLGTTGVIVDSVFDYVDQTLVGRGPVTIHYADGTYLVAEGMTYDAVTLVWTFSRATVTLPDTPGARKTEMQTP
jgi:lipopolysaccharide export system protein LptC